jgi:hypothetical protein
MKTIFVELADEDRTALERLAASSGMLAGKPVSMSAVVRQLVRDAAAKGAPVKVRA